MVREVEHGWRRDLQGSGQGKLTTIFTLPFLHSKTYLSFIIMYKSNFALSLKGLLSRFQEIRFVDKRSVFKFYHWKMFKISLIDIFMEIFVKHNPKLNTMKIE